MTTPSQNRENQRSAKQAREALNECASRYDWSRSEEDERALRAAAAEMSLALLRAAQARTPAVDMSPAIGILEQFMALCRAG